MGSTDNWTLPEDRPISEHEAAVVDWVLDNGSIKGSLDYLRQSIQHLRVVARCVCGCASVDFVRGGQSGGAHPIAEAIAHASHGREFGMIVWELDGRVSGIEVYEGTGSANELPSIEALRPWKSA